MYYDIEKSYEENKELIQKNYDKSYGRTKYIRLLLNTILSIL